MGTKSKRSARGLQQRLTGRDKRKHLDLIGNEDRIIRSSTRNLKYSNKVVVMKHQHTVVVTQNDEHLHLERRKVLEHQIDLLDKIIHVADPEITAYYEDQRRKLYISLYEVNNLYLFGSSSAPMDSTRPIRTHRQASPFSTQSDASSVHLGEDVSEFD
mmetsp:Transcript_13274/g.19992  ORF Transcript_13274/g.19992 Transcript_13274/m.19992 type:complete len:158 (+) Transcript_13274:137-610(+)